MAADVLSPLMKTRVLKAHVDAVLEVFDAANAAFKATGDMSVAAKVIAEAVVTATDDKTKYVVLIPPNLVYGPYASWAAASKAIDQGLAIVEGSVGTIQALIPAPKKERGKKK